VGSPSAIHGRFQIGTYEVAHGEDVDPQPRVEEGVVVLAAVLLLVHHHEVGRDVGDGGDVGVLRAAHMG
jgi:hypothetical protein